MKFSTFIMMVGLPGSGKSTAAEYFANLYNANIHSSDNIRKELFGDAEDQNHNKEVFEVLHKRIKKDIENQKNCIYDATNISCNCRTAFLREIRDFARKKELKIHARCVFVCTPVEYCIRWNKLRERQVPEEVIDSMYRRFDVPYYYEGWNKIVLYYPIRAFRNCYGKADEFILNHLDFNQNNEHHSLTLGGHLEKAREVIGGNGLISFATSIHDCGKPYCATFKNTKGEITEVCHYYNHERVGSYMTMFFDAENFSEFEKLYAAILVRWHMQPYFSKENFENKYSKKIGSDLVQDVLKIHRADVAAH